MRFVRDKINELIQQLIKIDDYITVKCLAEFLGVSPRTIHNYLNSKQFKEKTKGATIMKTPNKGVKLATDAQQKLTIMSNLEKELPIQKHVVSDFLNILFTLLETNEPLDINELSETYYTSTTNIRNILNAIDNFMEPFSCKIQHKRNHGISIKGDEKNIRSLFIFILLNHFSDISCNNRITKDHRFNTTTINALNYFLKPEETDNIIDIIDLIEKMLESHFSDADYSLFGLHLLILIVRTKQGFYISETNDTKLMETHEYLYATMIKSQIESKLYIKLTSEEIIYLTHILLSLRKQMNSLSIHYELDIVDKFIKALGYKLNVDLTHSPNLKKNLLTHLRPAINRLKYGIASNNLLLDKVKHEFTDIYISVMTTMDDLEKEENIHFDANEIGFICLHIIAALSDHLPKDDAIKAVLLCNEGLSFEVFLKNAIESNIDNIKITHIIRFDNFQNENFDNYDLVINTTSLAIECKKEVKITPNLSMEDLKAIQSFIYNLNETSVTEIIDDDYLIFFKDNIDNKDTLIIEYCDYLFQNGYVTKNYYQSVLSRMKINNTYVARGIAVPHGHPDYVIKSTIMIIILDNKIKWYEHNAQIILFIVSNNDQYQNYNTLLRKVMRIASSNEKTLSLLNCATKEDVYKIIKDA